LAAEQPVPADALYHCQQAAEKALKGFLVWHDQPFPKIHDLGRLGKQAFELDSAIENLIEEIVEFTKYAWMFRYPGDVEEPSVDDAGVVLSKAQAFVEGIQARLPAEAH
jgi:HEPN domain-containing protein